MAKNTEIEFIQKIKKSEKNSFFAVVCNQNKYNDTKSKIIKYLINEKKQYGIYVNLNRNCNETTDILKKNNIDTDKIYFVDGASRNLSKKEEGNQCTVIQGPESLTELSLVINELANTKKFDFLIFDSLSTLLVYNNQKMVEKFSQYIINRIKNQGIMGFMFSLDDDDSLKIMKTIGQFCDDMIEQK